jgi:hypothetical protein
MRQYQIYKVMNAIQTTLGALDLGRDEMLTYCNEHLDTMMIDDRQTALNILQLGVERKYILTKPCGSILRTAIIPTKIVREIYDFIQSTMVADD